MTAGTRTVAADWAWISKEPTGGIGYRVLATSADDVDFGPFIGRYVPGAPSSTISPDAPEAPPWVTFGPVAAERDDVLLSVSVRDRDPRQELDHAGRAVWSQQLLVMRFADLAAAGASFQTVWQEISKARVPMSGPGPLSLEVAGQQLGALAQAIERYGFDRLAATAAAVLEGPVVIADAAGLQREQRLEVLDAVASLLPYGFRASLPVSSVVDNTVNHGVRLVFADFPSDVQRLVSLQTDPPSPRTALGRHYLELLLEKKRARELDAVLEHLWAIKRPCSFEHPGIALAVLAELDFYGGFSQELRRGRPRREHVLKFFADPQTAQHWWESYDRPMRDHALSSLTGHDLEVTSTVFSCWRFTRDDVTRVINAQLDADGVELAAWCLEVARSAGGNLEDLLLGALLVPVGQIPVPGELSRRLARLVELLQHRPVPEPGKFRYSCDDLRFGDTSDWQAHLVRELLFRESAGEMPADRTVAWLRWLCRSPFGVPGARPDWIAALDFIVPESAGPQAAHSARSLLGGDPSWAAILMRLARMTGGIRRLVETGERALIELAATMPRPAEGQGPGALLRDELDVNLWDLDICANHIACLDVVRVLLGASPKDFDGQHGQDSRDSYLDGLGFAFGLPAMVPHRVAVQRAFLRHVVSHRKPGQLTPGGIELLNRWSQDEERIAALVGFIAGLPPDARPYSEDLREPYWKALGGHPELAGYAARHRLMTVARESARSPRTAFMRTIAELGPTSTPLASACYQARRSGLSSAEIVSALAGADANLIAPSQVSATLREFSELMYIHYQDTGRLPELPGPCRDPWHAAQADQLECYLLIALGAFGAPFSERFGPLLADLPASQSRIARRALRSISARRRKADPDTAARRAQEATRKWLEATASDPVKMRGPFLSRPSRR